MRKAVTTLMSAILLLMTGCSNNGEKSAAVSENNTHAASVKEYVDNNAFIDVDVEALVNIVANPDLRSSVNKDDVAKMKAAVYRFYSNVKIEDGYYTCNIPDGAAINISETVFSALKENLDEMNSAIKVARDEGREVKISEPDSTYLNSFLQ